MKVLLSLPMSILIVAMFSPTAWAFRCNSYVIDTGMPKIEVMQKCGSPSSQDTHVEHRVIRTRQSSQADYRSRDLLRNYRDRDSQEIEREIEVVIDEWIYNFGPTRFMQLLRFEDGRLVEIKDLGYGS